MKEYEIPEGYSMLVKRDGKFVLIPADGHDFKNECQFCNKVEELRGEMHNGLASPHAGEFRK
jgi:hypothetical protein